LRDAHILPENEEKMKSKGVNEGNDRKMGIIGLKVSQTLLVIPRSSSSSSGPEIIAGIPDAPSSSGTPPSWGGTSS